MCTHSLSMNRCVPEMDDYKPPKPQGQARWAIVALTRRTDILQRRNEQLAVKIRPFAKKHDITVIIFSELDFGINVKSSAERIFNNIAKVKFVNTYADGIKDENGRYHYGFRYLAKFFTTDMYKYLADYDYYWRVDSDDFLEELSYDLFEWVEREGVEFGWMTRKIDGHGATRRTLPPIVAEYVKRCQIWPSALMNDPLAKCFNFYNNFHVGKVSFFLRPDVVNFYSEMFSSGGVAKHHWSDSAIQAYAVRVFMDPGRIRMLPDMVYIHKSHGNLRISTFDKGVSTRDALPDTLPYWIDASHQKRP